MEGLRPSTSLLLSFFRVSYAFTKSTSLYSSLFELRLYLLIHTVSGSKKMDKAAVVIAFSYGKGNIKLALDGSKTR